MEFLLGKVVHWFVLLFNPAARAADRNATGNALLERGESDLALAAFSDAVRLDPNLAAAFCNRAAIHYEAGRYPEALVDLNEAIRLDRNFGLAYALRGHAYLNLPDQDRALADYEQALRLGAGDVEAAVRICRGRIWIDRNDLERAETDLDRTLFIEPRNGLGYLQRGHLRFMQMDWDRALLDYQEALRFGQDSPNLHACRGRIWLVKEQYDRAIRDLTVAIDRGLTDASLYESRGTAHLFNGQYDQAIADLDESLRRQTNDGPNRWANHWVAHNNRGTAYLNRGDFDQALADFQQAIRLQPDQPNAYKNLAWLQATCPQLGFRDGLQAIANATRALELTEWKATEWYEILAAAFAEAGDFAQAVSWQEKSLAAAPPDLRDEQQARLELYRAGQPYRHRVPPSAAR